MWNDIKQVCCRGNKKCESTVMHIGMLTSACDNAVRGNVRPRLECECVKEQDVGDI